MLNGRISGGSMLGRGVVLPWVDVGSVFLPCVDSEWVNCGRVDVGSGVLPCVDFWIGVPFMG